MAAVVKVRLKRVFDDRGYGYETADKRFRVRQGEAAEIRAWYVDDRAWGEDHPSEMFWTLKECREFIAVVLSCPNEGRPRSRKFSPGATMSHSIKGIRSIKALKAAVPSLVAGATVDDESERFGQITLESPAGSVWAANSCHTLLMDWGPLEGTASWRQTMIKDAIADALERLEDGVTPCGDPECDYCHPVED
jgi:hypothetical protein